MSEKTSALGIKVNNLHQSLLPFHPRIGRTSSRELSLNKNLENAQPTPSNQPASRELILHLIEALKEL